MLQNRYEFDPQFWSVIEQLAIKMEPELAQIDKILEDDALFEMIWEDLSKRYPKTPKTGRHSTPVEVILRMLAVKRLYALSYEEVEKHVRDSLVLRWFCRVYFHPVFDHTNLIKWAQLIEPTTLHAFNERLTRIATELKLSRARKLRTDGTVVSSNLHYPTDSSLLSDGVRVLSRAVRRAKGVFKASLDLFRDRSRGARKYARKIARAAREKSEKSKESIKRFYERLLYISMASLKASREVLDRLTPQSSARARRLQETLKAFIPRLDQVIGQTIRRVFLEEVVPAKEKLASLFEPHTDIIRRGKARSPTEFGHKVWLDEVEGGIVSGYRILAGNPPDQDQFRPSLEHHLFLFGKPPHEASGDRGLYSPENEAYARVIGVKHTALPKPGYKSEERKAHEKQPWFRKALRFRAGIEGRISVLKRKHGLDLCFDHGESGFERWVGWGVIAGNLAVMGSKLAKR